jgi:hypothetical protein
MGKFEFKLKLEFENVSLNSGKNWTKFEDIGN